MDLLAGAQLIPKHGVNFNVDRLRGKTVLLYFTGEWCPPCRVFTPELIKFYFEFIDEKNFEVILISSDRTEAEYKHTIKELPWTALAFKDQTSKRKLAQMYNIKGIPSLVVLDGTTGETINENARYNLVADPTGEQFPWKK